MRSVLSWLREALGARTNLKRWQLFLICFSVGLSIAGVIVLGKLQLQDAEQERENLQRQTAALAVQNARQARTDKRLADAIERLERLENPTRREIRKEIQRIIKGIRDLPPAERRRIARVLDSLTSPERSRGGGGTRDGRPDGGGGGESGNNSNAGIPPSGAPPSGAPSAPSTSPTPPTPTPAPSPISPIPPLLPPDIDLPPIDVDGSGPLPPVDVPPIPLFPR